MIKTLLGQVKEFKLVSLLTPLGMLAEVIVENFIPLQMAVIIDSIGKNDLSTIYKTEKLIATFKEEGFTEIKTYSKNKNHWISIVATK